MAFSILSRRAIEENKGIMNIVNKIRDYSPIFSHSQATTLGFKVDVSTDILLKDFDTYSNRGVTYRLDVYNTGKFEDVYYNDYTYGLPIIKYDEIKDDSTVIEEDDDTITIEYGRGITGSIKDGQKVREMANSLIMGDIEDSGRKITICVKKDGSKIKLKVYRNNKTGEEFVFMNNNYDGTYSDRFNEKATFIGIVSPIKWVVDKKTGLAICNRPFFIVEDYKTEYKGSPLEKYLESQEFIDDICVKGELVKENNPVRKNNPFGTKKEKMNLEQTIRRVLLGGKRIPYLVGHPGVGKTQVAKSICKNYVSFNIGTFTPDAFTGKTSIIPGDKIITHEDGKTIEHSERGRTATAEPDWYTKTVAMSEKCRKTNERCVLLLDEFDKLTPNMQVFINGIVDDPRTIAGWEIPDNVDIILAGNTEEYSDAAFAISGEVESRLTKIEVTADAIDWLKWASKHQIDPVVKAYLHNFPEKIIQDIMKDDGKYDYAISLTPRAWDQKISAELKECRKINKVPHLEPYMDPENLKAFEEFMNLYFDLGVEEILKGNLPDDIFDLTHDKIQIIINCLIATATTEEELINALLFIRENHLSEYEALFEKRWTEINNTDDDILKLKLAKNEVNERSSNYGK